MLTKCTGCTGQGTYSEMCIHTVYVRTYVYAKYVLVCVQVYPLEPVSCNIVFIVCGCVGIL